VIRGHVPNDCKPKLDSAGVVKTTGEYGAVAISEVCFDFIKEVLSFQIHYIPVLTNPSVRGTEESFVLRNKNRFSHQLKREWQY
jgi:hypothetical protein